MFTKFTEERILVPKQNYIDIILVIDVMKVMPNVVFKKKSVIRESLAKYS